MISLQYIQIVVDVDDRAIFQKKFVNFLKIKINFTF